MISIRWEITVWILPYWMKCLFASIRLRLFNFNGLGRWLYLYTIKMYVKMFNLQKTTLGGFHIYRSGQCLYMYCYLEVIFFLTNERIVGVAKVKTFIRINTIANLTAKYIVIIIIIIRYTISLLKKCLLETLYVNCFFSFRSIWYYKM